MRGLSQKAEKKDATKQRGKPGQNGNIYCLTSNEICHQNCLPVGLTPFRRALNQP